MGYDPNESRDDQGKWSGLGGGLGRKMAKNIVDKSESRAKEHLVYKALEQGGKVDKNDLQCHQLVCDAPAAVKEHWWKGDLKQVNWDESKHEAVVKAMKELPHPKVSGAAKDLLVDIEDMSINGHSFMTVNDRVVDPFLHFSGAKPADIQKTGAYLLKVFARAGVRNK